jgi:hypothetical protein
MTRGMFVALGLVLLVACEDKPKATAASSAAPLASEDSDRLAAVKLEPDKAPSYQLSKLGEKDLSTLLTRAGWKVTVLGKSAPDSKATRVRATAVKSDRDGTLESFTVVHCGSSSNEHPAGSAYYEQGECLLEVEARRGIRAKTQESKKLLTALLGASL